MAKRRKADKTGRSAEDQYWNLPYTLARSEAFRSLPGPALKVFVELRCRFNGGNNGKLTLSLDEAARLLGLSKTTAKRAFTDLEARGFIKLRVKGSWYGRKASEWILTTIPLNGVPSTNEWKQWQSGKAPREAKKTVARYPNGIPQCFDDAA
jgi:predicted RNA binding protein YcfA (HicA-like mRNA interferase family)